MMDPETGVHSCEICGHEECECLCDVCELPLEDCVCSEFDEADDEPDDE